MYKLQNILYTLYIHMRYPQFFGRRPLGSRVIRVEKQFVRLHLALVQHRRRPTGVILIFVLSQPTGEFSRRCLQGRTSSSVLTTVHGRGVMTDIS